MFARIMAVVLAAILLTTVCLSGVWWLTLRNRQIDARLDYLISEAEDIAYLAGTLSGDSLMDTISSSRTPRASCSRTPSPSSASQHPTKCNQDKNAFAVSEGVFTRKMRRPPLRSTGASTKRRGLFVLYHLCCCFGNRFAPYRHNRAQMRRRKTSY